MSDTPPKRKRARRSDALDLTEEERKERKRGLDARYRHKQASIRRTSVNIESQMSRWLEFKTLHRVTDDEEVAKMLLDHHERIDVKVKVESVDDRYNSHDVNACSSGNHGDESCFSRNHDDDGSSSESGGLVMKLVTDDAQDTVVVYKNID
ncbi:hypothetical protein LOTGIDRAFT_227854 [Lottia gigantea]|uniref:Uncharacterized protein n=1 Tax=Lottia gigantea TaxID=225164 RepID=V4ALW0_LOTGI|nr:hypothetical protein LOTGIDRAFT_227854 [Lottia gigantea]ESP05174.1 hypothetical protein LOTGIDRAFT_227854 [Lottia gigantea]